MSDSEQISLFDLEPTPPPPQPKLEVAIAPVGEASNVSGIIYANLDELKAVAVSCQKCPLAATRINVVVERGNREAKVMIIGEAPGQNEDEQGLPFVGRAGQLLDKILESVGFDESNVYICNINKCRPPGNRVPTDEEVAACKPYLLEQIRLIDPKIILLTGATAVKAIMGDKRGITKIRGQWMEWEGRLVMPILHPAYLLRNPSREEGSPKWLMWQDIQVVKAKYLEFMAESPSIEEEEF
jgi:uracil-DNA glycosylase